MEHQPIRLFLIAGRIPGQDDDTVEIFDARDMDHAIEAFKAKIYTQAGESPKDILDSYDEDLYLTVAKEIGPDTILRADYYAPPATPACHGCCGSACHH